MCMVRLGGTHQKQGSGYAGIGPHAEVGAQVPSGGWAEYIRDLTLGLCPESCVKRSLVGRWAGWLLRVSLGNELTTRLGLPPSPSQGVLLGVLGARWDVGGEAQVPSGAAQLCSQGRVRGFGHRAYVFKDTV